LDAQASTPGTREEVYCTKDGSAHPGERYIVVCRLTPPDPCHARAHDVHLAGMDAADLGAVPLFARARRAGLRVERAQPGVGLPEGIVVDAGAGAHAAVAATARGAARVAGRSGPFCPGTRWRRLIVVRQARDIGTAV